MFPDREEWQIDRDDARAGQRLFEKHCRGCHGPHAASIEQLQIEAPLKQSTSDHWKVKVYHYDVIGTDSLSARNFDQNRFDISPMGVTGQQLSSLFAPCGLPDWLGR